MTGLRTLSKSLHFFGSEFPHLQNGDNYSRDRREITNSGCECSFNSDKGSVSLQIV